MNKFVLYALATGIALTSASVAHADHHKMDKSELFAKIDSNGDGMISNDEFTQHKTDWKGKKKHRHKNKRNRMIEEVDQNDDGILSEDEFMTRSRERFATLDANKDGKVTKDEVEKHHETMREKRMEKRAEKDKNEE